VAGKTILVIDPDAASRAFISSTLRQHEHTVLQAASGREGLIVAWRDHPDLLIIEPLLADLSGQQLATKLRQDPRTAHKPLVALSREHQPESRTSCLEAGFNEYIVKSTDAIPKLIEVINRLVAEAVVPEAAPLSRNGLCLAFISAKGGIGTSSICANLGMNIAQNEPDSRIAMLDLVLPIGSIATIVGYPGDKNLITLADLSPEQIAGSAFREHMHESKAWRFDLLAGSPDPDTASRLKVDKIPGILSQLQAAYDYVLIDMGRSLARFSLPLIQGSDLIVLIVSTDLSSITVTKTLIDYLHLKGIKDEAIFIILNRAEGLEGLTKAEAEKELGIEIKTTFPYLVHFTLANNQHQPFVLKYPGDNSSVIAFKDVAGRVAATARQLRMARSNNDD
jgi:pilus assembly protein CpaE